MNENVCHDCGSSRELELRELETGPLWLCPPCVEWFDESEEGQQQDARQLLVDAMNVIGGVWNGAVETLQESRGEAREVYHDISRYLDATQQREDDR